MCPPLRGYFRQCRFGLTGGFRATDSRPWMSPPGVRREKAALSSGCKPRPATAPAGSYRSVSRLDLRAHRHTSPGHKTPVPDGAPTRGRVRPDQRPGKTTRRLRPTHLDNCSSEPRRYQLIWAAHSAASAFGRRNRSSWRSTVMEMRTQQRLRRHLEVSLSMSTARQLESAIR